MLRYEWGWGTLCSDDRLRDTREEKCEKRCFKTWSLSHVLASLSRSYRLSDMLYHSKVCGGIILNALFSCHAILCNNPYSVLDLAFRLELYYEAGMMLCRGLLSYNLSVWGPCLEAEKGSATSISSMDYCNTFLWSRSIVSNFHLLWIKGNSVIAEVSLLVYLILKYFHF